VSEATQQFSLKGLFDEAKQEFGSPDRGFVRTFLMMTKAPGATLRALFRGEATELTKPIRFFLLVFTLYSLVYVSTGAMDIIAGEVSKQLADSLNQTYASGGIAIHVAPEDMPKVNPLTYYLQYPMVSELLMLVLLWLTSWPALARMGLDGTQRFGAVLYLPGTVNLLQLPFVALVFLGRADLINPILSIGFLIYLAWVTHDLALAPRRWAFLRGVAWFVMLQLVSMLVFGIAMAKTMYDLERRAPAAAVERAPG
jgi:hypothetical protein